MATFEWYLVQHRRWWSLCTHHRMGLVLSPRTRLVQSTQMWHIHGMFGSMMTILAMVQLGSMWPWMQVCPDLVQQTGPVTLCVSNMSQPYSSWCMCLMLYTHRLARSRTWWLCCWCCHWDPHQSHRTQTFWSHCNQVLIHWTPCQAHRTSTSLANSCQCAVHLATIPW